jgi:hypothetical protein
MIKRGQRLRIVNIDNNRRVKPFLLESVHEKVKFICGSFASSDCTITRIVILA